MEYTVLFDVVQGGFRQWTFPAFGLIFIAIGTVSAIFRRQFQVRSFPVVFLVFALFWTATAFSSTFFDYQNLSSALREGRCKVVEGVVTEFHTGPKSESFVVEGQRFAYSDYTVIAGFNNMQSHGGPIHDGMRVRIHYYHIEIARLEVAR